MIRAAASVCPVPGLRALYRGYSVRTAQEPSARRTAEASLEQSE